MKPILHWVALLLLCCCVSTSGQVPEPARTEQEVKKQLAGELAGLAEWCSENDLLEPGRRLLDEILFIDPRNLRALALQVPLADDSNPAAPTSRPEFHRRQALTGRAVAPLYLELFAQRHRPVQNALYDVYLLRALEHDPRFAAPVFQSTWKTALDKKDWSRARMLLTQGREFAPVNGYQARIRTIDAAEMAELRRQLVPGGSFVLKFPELGPTVKKDYRLMQMRVVLPREYSPDRRWPLYISLGGGSGSDRPNRLVDGLGFVAIALPYPRNPRNLAQGSFDPFTLWSSYKPMLEKLQQVIPNLDPSRRVVFGFSNGANAITALVAFSDTEFTKKHRYLIIHEGGMYQRRWSDDVWRELKSCSILYSGGDRSIGRQVSTMHQAALDHGVDAELLIYEGGHEMNPRIGASMRQWIRRKVLE